MPQHAGANTNEKPRPPHAIWPVASFLAAVVLALVGQQLVGGREHVVPGAICFGLAVVLFLAPLARWRWDPDRPDVPPAGSILPSTPLVRHWLWRLVFALTALLLALLAFTGFHDNRLTGGLWVWLAAILYFAAAFAYRPAGGWRAALKRWAQGIDWRVAGALLAITLLSVFFRVYRLDAVPAEMTSDHAEKLLDVHDVLQGWRPIFFPRNTGREMVQFYLTAALIRFTPLTLGHLALKVGTALVGIATIPFTYLLGKELYGRPAGLLAAFFLAVSHWHVAITRVGLRFPFTAAFAAPALYFFLCALRANRRNDWLAAGAILGLGLHTYTAMRVVPLLFLVLILLKLIADGWQVASGRWQVAGGTSPHLPTRSPAHPFTVTFWANGLLGAAATLLLFLPLLRYMVGAPEMFWYRALSRATDPAGGAPPPLWPTFWGNVKNALLMFNYRGDVVPANTIPLSPVLGRAAGALFVLGVAFLLWRWLRTRERQAVYLLASTFVLLLPSILSLAYPGENPSVVRTGGAVPFVALIVALPLVAMGQRLRSLPGRVSRVACAGLLAALLLIAVADNAVWYFVDYDAHIRQSLWNATEMGAVAREFADAHGGLEHVYHVPYPYWVDTRNIAINAGDITWRNTAQGMEEFRRQALDPAPKLYLLFPEDQGSLKKLREVYPAGEMQVYDSARPGKDFLRFYVPAGE